MSHHYSLGRRFVVAIDSPCGAGQTQPIADGVEFSNGVVVLAHRNGGPIEIYQNGVQQLPDVVRPGIDWVDSTRIAPATPPANPPHREKGQAPS